MPTEKMGEQDVLLVPPIILSEKQQLRLLPSSRSFVAEWNKRAHTQTVLPSNEYR